MQLKIKTVVSGQWALVDPCHLHKGQDLLDKLTEAEKAHPRQHMYKIGQAICFPTGRDGGFKADWIEGYAEHVAQEISVDSGVIALVRIRNSKDESAARKYGVVFHTSQQWTNITANHKFLNTDSFSYGPKRKCVFGYHNQDDNFISINLYL